jgi:hypothetical protein
MRAPQSSCGVTKWMHERLTPPTQKSSAPDRQGDEGSASCTDNEAGAPSPVGMLTRFDTTTSRAKIGPSPIVRNLPRIALET